MTGVVSRYSGGGTRPLADPRNTRIALVRLRTGLGDLLASVPALRALRAARPDAHVTLVTYPEMAEVVARQEKYVDELLPFPGHPDIPDRPAPDPVMVETFFGRCRERRFDVAVQMYGALPAANAVTKAIGATVTAGFVTPGAWPADLATHLPYPAHAHEVDRHLRLMTFLGIPPASGALEFPLNDTDRRQAEGVLDEFRLRKKRFAVLHPGATAPSRRWPVDRFAAVGDGLVRRGFAVAVTGVPAERELVDAVRGSMREPSADLCGRTDLGGLAAIIALAAVVVSGDTGVVQLAVAAQTPSATVYLAGSAARWRGPDPQRNRVIAVDVGCNPCGLLACPIDFRCALSVSPALVLAEAEGALHAVREAPDELTPHRPSTP
jgi:ADP-heptose:LPS heptosyltransferase